MKERCSMSLKKNKASRLLQNRPLGVKKALGILMTLTLLPSIGLSSDVFADSAMATPFETSSVESELTASLVEIETPETPGYVPGNVSNIYPDVGLTSAVLDNRLFFFADDRIHGIELWMTDLETHQSSMVADLGTSSQSLLSTSQPSEGFSIWGTADNELVFSQMLGDANAREVIFRVGEATDWVPTPITCSQTEEDLGLCLEGNLSVRRKGWTNNQGLVHIGSTNIFISQLSPKDGRLVITLLRPSEEWAYITIPGIGLIDGDSADFVLPAERKTLESVVGDRFYYGCDEVGRSLCVWDAASPSLDVSGPPFLVEEFGKSELGLTWAARATEVLIGGVSMLAILSGTSDANSSAWLILENDPVAREITGDWTPDDHNTRGFIGQTSLGLFASWGRLVSGDESVYLVDYPESLLDARVRPLIYPGPIGSDAADRYLQFSAASSLFQQEAFELEENLGDGELVTRSFFVASLKRSLFDTYLFETSGASTTGDSPAGVEALPVKDAATGSELCRVQDVTKIGSALYFSAFDCPLGVLSVSSTKSLWSLGADEEGATRLSGTENSQILGTADQSLISVVSTDSGVYVAYQWDGMVSSAVSVDGTPLSVPELDAVHVVGQSLSALYFSVEGFFAPLEVSVIGGEAIASPGQVEGVVPRRGLGPYGLESFGESLYFRSDSLGEDSSLFVSDGSGVGTHQVLTSEGEQILAYSSMKELNGNVWVIGQTDVQSDDYSLFYSEIGSQTMTALTFGGDVISADGELASVDDQWLYFNEASGLSKVRIRDGLIEVMRPTFSESIDGFNSGERIPSGSNFNSNSAGLSYITSSGAAVLTESGSFSLIRDADGATLGTGDVISFRLVDFGTEQYASLSTAFPFAGSVFSLSPDAIANELSYEEDPGIVSFTSDLVLFEGGVYFSSRENNNEYTLWKIPEPGKSAAVVARDAELLGVADGKLWFNQYDSDLGEDVVSFLSGGITSALRSGQDEFGDPWFATYGYNVPRLPNGIIFTAKCDYDQWYYNSDLGWCHEVNEESRPLKDINGNELFASGESDSSAIVGNQFFFAAADRDGMFDSDEPFFNLYSVSLSSSVEDSPQMSNPAVPYSGPVITAFSNSSPQPGELLSMSGSGLSDVTSLSLDGVQVEIASVLENKLVIVTPLGLSPGLKDLVLKWPGGTLTVQNALNISAAATDSGESASLVKAKGWTKKLSDSSAKIYTKDVVGAGKVKFVFNGKEIAWVRATSETNPKLRTANGVHYLVRTVELIKGQKNILEIYLDGTRIKRVAYSY